MHPRELWDTSLREFNKGSSLDMSYARYFGGEFKEAEIWSRLDALLGNRSNSMAEMLSKSRKGKN